MHHHHFGMRYLRTAPAASIKLSARAQRRIDRLAPEAPGTLSVLYRSRRALERDLAVMRGHGWKLAADPIAVRRWLFLHHYAVTWVRAGGGSGAAHVHAMTSGGATRSLPRAQQRGDERPAWGERAVVAPPPPQPAPAGLSAPPVRTPMPAAPVAPPPPPPVRRYNRHLGRIEQDIKALYGLSNAKAREEMNAVADAVPVELGYEEALAWVLGHRGDGARMKGGR